MTLCTIECQTPYIYWSLFIMAANFQDMKGYDHEFVDPPPDDLLCLICLCLARDPQQINCCGKVLCKSCLETHEKRFSSTCPQCRKPIKTFGDKRSKYFHMCPYESFLITMTLFSQYHR